MSIFTRWRKAIGVETAPCPYSISVSIRSDKGCHRPSNEDYASYSDPPPSRPEAERGLLAVIADGMGGHAAGEVASEMAVRVLERIYYRSSAEPHKALEMAFLEVNRRIYRTAQRHPRYQGMGTTCTALVLKDGAAYCAHVGDSRLYLVRDDAIYLMTEDHSVAMQMLRQGLITPDEARHHQDKHVLLRALGTKLQLSVSTWSHPFPLRMDDRFLLCTDGAHDLVHEDDIKRIALAEEPATACEQLIALAKQRGGYDNITVGVLHVKAAADLLVVQDRHTRLSSDQPTRDALKERER